MIILCDLDSVVIDLMPAWLALYNADYHDNLKPSDITGWNTHLFVKDECGKKVYEYLSDPHLYENCLPVSWSLWGVSQLRDAGHRVVFLTAANSSSMGQKLEWLYEWGYLPKKSAGDTSDFIAAKDKSLIRGDIMIDDGLHNLDAWAGNGPYHASKILFDQPWNKHDTQYKRAIDWKEVVSICLQS